MGSGHFVYQSPVRHRPYRMRAFWAPWYNGRRLFWRIRLGAWILSAALAALIDLRFAPLGPLAIEVAFCCVVGYGYLRFERAHRGQLRQARPPRSDA